MKEKKLLGNKTSIEKWKNQGHRGKSDYSQERIKFKIHSHCNQPTHSRGEGGLR